jgi:hypothetical protein
MNGWHFTYDADGWHWHRMAGGVVLHHTRSQPFSSLLECLNDATTNGFSVVVPAQNLPVPFSKLL